MMKNFLAIIIIIALATIIAGSIAEKTPIEDKKPDNDEKEIIDNKIEYTGTANVSEYYIYGNHLSMSGSLESVDTDDVYVVFGESTKFKLNSTNENGKIVFFTEKEINRGIDLELISLGDFKPYLSIGDKNYELINDTEYKKTTYYGFNNQEIEIIDNFDFYVNKTEETVYDIIIDPGHGGIDPGAVNGNIYESTLNLDISLRLKKLLTDAGFKVFLTREDSGFIPVYGEDSRTIAPYEKKAKLFISVHHNSTYFKNEQSGLEVYVANNVNIDFAKDMAKSIVDATPIDYSTYKINKLASGVYQRNFRESEIEEFRQEFKEDGITFYDSVTTDTNYYFVIRETGGYITGAYTDGRNLKKDLNPYHNSNIGAESILLELGYMNHYYDLKVILNNKDAYAKGIANSIIRNYGSYIEKR